MIEKIENLEALFSKEPNQELISGLMCFQMHAGIAVTGNEHLIKLLENGG